VVAVSCAPFIATASPHYLVCPVPASCPEAPVASPLLRAGVQEDGDRSEADLGTRDTPDRKE